MKIVILGAEARYRAYQPAMPFIQQQELVFLDKDSTEAEILAAGADAEVLFVDAITVVSAALMEHMPCLRLIHSEGVAFDRIDLSAARERGIYVCNNKGCNAGAVAEQTVLLILMLLRHALEGDEAVRAGRQMEMKERWQIEASDRRADAGASAGAAKGDAFRTAGAAGKNGAVDRCSAASGQ